MFYFPRRFSPAKRKNRVASRQKATFLDGETDPDPQIDFNFNKLIKTRAFSRFREQRWDEQALPAQPRQQMSRFGAIHPQVVACNARLYSAFSRFQILVVKTPLMGT